MHLAGEAKGSDGLLRLRSGCERTNNSFFCCAPPVFRILLSPAGTIHSEWRVLGGSAADEPAVFIHHNGARAARAYVHSKEPH
jgi:hypothetical protein